VIERYHLFLHDFPQETSKELQLFSIIAQSFFQPFSLMDNLLVIMTALTAGSGLGFNRAMLFLAKRGALQGTYWLGPASLEEAESIWRVLSTPGIGYYEIIEHNRALVSADADTLTKRIKSLTFPLDQNEPQLPALAAASKEIILVKEASNEPLVDRRFLETIAAEEFLCIPLVGKEEILGEIVLDNAITRRPIENRDIELASLCGLIAGNFIYTSHLQRRIVEMKKVAAMGEMAMFVTHQLRNPLVTIGGFADQLLDPRSSAAKRERNLKIIRAEIRRLERILLRLTQFLKVDIKEPVPVDIREMFKLVSQAVRPRLAGKKLTLKTEIEPGLNSAFCDPIHAGEALRNILDNAIDAVDVGGTIELRAYRENDEWAVLSVRDNGKGIPERVKEKIFEAFVSTKEKGMGLGLAYVKRVVEACRGRIVVDSQEGQGTTFRLYFRAKPKEGEFKP